MLLEITDLNKSFGDRRLLSLKKLCLYAGDRVAVVGRNGAGKTTLLRMIAEEETPDSGRNRPRCGWKKGSPERRRQPIKSNMRCARWAAASDAAQLPLPARMGVPRDSQSSTTHAGLALRRVVQRGWSCDRSGNSRSPKGLASLFRVIRTAGRRRTRDPDPEDPEPPMHADSGIYPEGDGAFPSLQVGLPSAAWNLRRAEQAKPPCTTAEGTHPRRSTVLPADRGACANTRSTAVGRNKRRGTTGHRDESRIAVSQRRPCSGPCAPSVCQPCPLNGCNNPSTGVKRLAVTDRFTCS